MKTETGQSLSQAYEMIEAAQLDEARSALKTILDNEQDNADAWWLYAHAVTDPDTARLALNNVLRLDPGYPDAAELLETLEAQASGRNIDFEDENNLGTLPPAPATLPDMSSPELEGEDWDAFDGEDERVPFWRRPAFLLAAGLILFLIIAAVVILSPPGQSQQQNTPTTIVQEVEFPTESPNIIDVSPTIEVNPQQTESSMNVGAGDERFDTLRQSLSTFQMPDDAIFSEVTQLGNTIVVRLCTEPGPTLRATVKQAMAIISQDVNSFLMDEDAVGVQMIDCAANNTLLTLVTKASDFTDYANGSLTEEEFQSRWISVE